MNRVDNSVLPEDQDVTQKVLTGFDFSKSMEQDIESVESDLDDSKIDFEEFESFLDERLTQISSWNSRASSVAERLNDGDSSIDEAYNLIHIPAEKDSMVLRSGEAARLNTVLRDSQLLIGQLTVMLKLAVDALDAADDAVDIQKQNKVRKEVMRMMKDNMDQVMASSVRSAFSSVSEVEELRERVESVERSVEEVSSGGGVDREVLIEEVQERIDDEMDDFVDLRSVVGNSEIENLEDLGKILKHETGLKNQQVADIIGSTEGSVSTW